MKQVVIFKCFDQSFALEISNIERIIEYNIPKKIPEASDYLLGIVKYNDTILPIIDLAIRLFKSNHGIDNEKRILVVKWKNINIGLLVDTILGIQNISDVDFEEATLQKINISKEYIKGFIKKEDDIVILLDTNMLFTSEQTEELINVQTLEEEIQVI